jgi:predicted CxxxxCH...CXXCH cytochrome family protein
MALLAVGFVAACGSSRQTAEDRPLCQRCHGGASGNEAPPRAIDGATATTAAGVGAHQAHLTAGRLRGPIACADCHVVPADMSAHEARIAAIAAGTATRLTWGTLATTDGSTPVFALDATSTPRCSSTYCHGGSMGHGGSIKAPAWTVVDGTQAACGTCHGNPPPGHLASSTQCSSCHAGTVNADGSIKFAADGTSLHMNGTHELPAGGGCTGCHAAPPATGAHLAHVVSEPGGYGQTSGTPIGAAGYDFGCGNCHSLDAANHMSAAVDLSPTGAPAGSLKALNDPAAAYDPVAGTCTSVYCHSSGQVNPAFVASPAWTTGTSPGCGGCHGNPPNYPNGGAGSATANSHVGLLAFSGELIATGHFAGLPAALHQGSAHGGGIGSQFAGDSAAPITCQACHFDTVDPTFSPVSGFYYWNPDGAFDVSPSTPGTIVVDCATCHSTTPPAGRRVVTFLHVNGSRDVSFDRRQAITGTPTLPGSPNDPTLPYWYTRATTNKDGQPSAIVSDAVAASVVPGIDLKGTTLELDLSAATWNADKSCSSVACHLNRLQAGSPAIRWGDFAELDSVTGQPTGRIDPAAVCTVCHGN